MINSREERGAMRRRLSAMHEEQLQDIVFDVGLSPHVGGKASRSELARSIVQFADSSSENWQWLLRELEEKYTTLLRSNGQLELSLAMETRLYGILSDVFDSHPIWIRTAVAIATQNLFMDRDYLDGAEELQDVLAPLTSIPQSSSEPLNPLTLPLTHFAALFCKIAGKKGHSDLSDKLRSWLDELLDGTSFSFLSVAGKARLPNECLWAPAIEIGWNPYTLSRFPEVFVRWAGLRHRIEIPTSTASRRIQATLACEFIESNPHYSGIDIDHVEVSVDMKSISLPWELKNESSVDDEEPKRPKWPVTVRLCKSCGPASRVEHDGMILDEATIQSSIDEDELIAISATQAFTFAFEHVDSVGPSSALRVAVNKFSAVLWSRKPIAPDRHTLVKRTLHGKTIYDLPKVIHRARFDCSKTSIWRQMVLFYDPNLPPFEFSVTDDDQDSELILTYQEINEALY